MQYTVCARVVDATTDVQMTNVFFYYSIDNGFEESTFDEDGEICFNSILPGTYFEFLAEKSGYTNGSISGYANDDMNWVIALNPMVNTKYKLDHTTHFYSPQSFEANLKTALFFFPSFFFLSFFLRLFVKIKDFLFFKFRRFLYVPNSCSQ